MVHNTLSVLTSLWPLLAVQTYTTGTWSPYTHYYRIKKQFETSKAGIKSERCCRHLVVKERRVGLEQGGEMETNTTTSSCWIRWCRRCDDVSKWSRKFTNLPFHKGSAIVWLGSYWKTNFSSSCFLEVCQSFMIGVISWTCLVSSVPARMYISCLLAHAFSALTFELSSNSLPVYQ